VENRETEPAVTEAQVRAMLDPVLKRLDAQAAQQGRVLAILDGDPDRDQIGMRKRIQQVETLVGGDTFPKRMDKIEGILQTLVEVVTYGKIGERVKTVEDKTYQSARELETMARRFDQFLADREREAREIREEREQQEKQRKRELGIFIAGATLNLAGLGGLALAIGRVAGVGP
jgi:23S rRNA C2498 (ribose-2'-O)-methylase RlmM